MDDSCGLNWILKKYLPNFFGIGSQYIVCEHLSKIAMPGLSYGAANAHVHPMEHCGQKVFTK